MRKSFLHLAALAVLAAGSLAAPGAPVWGQAGATQEIEAFNRRFREAILSMDNRTTMALWAEDGVTLLPGMAPIAGKQTIARWLDDVTAQMPGYRVARQDNQFHDIRVAGDWASEWGTTDQTVQPPGGKPPLVIHGKILLVLHRDASGSWKIQEEMWNSVEAAAPGK
ncbi:MAG TPA: DUF4440 domain-containing protein [Thermoanaerobaculia bacterium]